MCDQIKNTTLKQLFDPEKLIFSAEDGANVFARGKYGASQEVMPTCMREIRKSVESCSTLHSIKFLNASGGGSNFNDSLGSILIYELEVDLLSV